MITVYSPVRISFAGGGTDISPFPEKYGGAVFNTTIDRGIMIRYVDDGGTLEISSRDFLKTSLISSDNTSMENQIIKLFTDEGITTGRLIMNSDVPPGSGLGSSSALLNGVIKTINIINVEKKKKRELTPLDLAHLSYTTEKEKLNIILGKQDPYAIAVGGLKYMEFGSSDPEMQAFDINTEFVHELEKSMMLVYTGNTRESSKSLQEQAIKSALGDEETMDKLKSLKNLAVRMKQAMISEDHNAICEIINKGWEIKKTLGSNVSNGRIENMIHDAFSHGARSAKLLGGGSEGFILVMTEPENVNELQKKMRQSSKFVIRLKFDGKGTRVINNYIDSDI
jgi:D-glycero-alpha-D-manno-heptose-7-phosphate kinase